MGNKDLQREFIALSVQNRAWGLFSDGGEPRFSRDYVLWLEAEVVRLRTPATGPHWMTGHDFLDKDQ